MNQEIDPPPQGAVDFSRIKRDLQPGDVILVEGRSRISLLVKTVSMSIWTHAAIYIGRIAEIEDPALRERIRQHHQGADTDKLIVEALLGQGTIIRSIDHYSGHHVRICRPHTLTPEDARIVIAHAVDHAGAAYDLRQMFDLARLLYPYSLLPRRWRSTLFHADGNASVRQRTICSTLIADAFARVAYPIVPQVVVGADGRRGLRRSNPRLCTPRDFDTSPYFTSVKYPLLEITERGGYRDLEWFDPDAPVAVDPGPPPRWRQRWQAWLSTTAQWWSWLRHFAHPPLNH